jgi:hypothetical protein
MKNNSFWRSPHFLIILVLMVGAIIALGYQEKWLKKEKDMPRVLQPTELDQIKHNVKDNLYFDVKILNIGFTRIANGSVEITLKFTISNPYPTSQAVYVPQYFYVTSSFLNKHTGSSFSKMCQCWNNHGTVLTQSGLELYKELSRDNSGRYIFNLGAKDSREFQVRFAYNSPVESGEISLCGFDVSESENHKLIACLKIKNGTGQILSKTSVDR